MNILTFSFEAPSKLYGGGIGIIQSLSSLCNFAFVDYIGPDYDETEFETIRVRRKYILNDNNSVAVKVLNLFRGVTTRYYQEWKRATESLDPKMYDAVFIDFSYNDFIVDWAHKHGLKAVVRVHNIERDMSYTSAKGKVHDKYWLRNNINGWLIARREEKVMKTADRLVFLTKEDLSRACELYGKDVAERAVIVPVCMDMNHKNADYSETLPKPYILATGSLYYGPNANGIKWFIEKVWKEFNVRGMLPEYSLIVAGRNPGNDLKKLAEETARVKLIDSPKEMSPFFLNADMYVAPVFEGAGMKVKVAEALSYGLTVVGSHHALIGYEEAEPFITEANTAEEFLEKILAVKKNPQKKSLCQEKYQALYTLTRSGADFKGIVESMLK